MKKTYHTTKHIIRILREVETAGQSHEAICREHNTSSQTFYRWKSKYGGMGLPEVQRHRHDFPRGRHDDVSIAIHAGGGNEPDAGWQDARRIKKFAA